MALPKWPYLLELVLAEVLAETVGEVAAEGLLEDRHRNAG